MSLVRQPSHEASPRRLRRSSHGAAAALVTIAACLLWVWPFAVCGAAELTPEQLYVPQSNPAADQHLDRLIILNQKIVRARPNDSEAYFNLADAYINKGRQTGDVTYFTLAAAALTQALKLKPDLVPARRHLAYIHYTLHDFSAAAAQAQDAIKLDPMDSYAYGVLGDADLETGHYAEAARAYDTMVALRRDLYSYCRRAGLESVHGNTAAALEDLEQAIRYGVASAEPPEHVAWAQWQLGNEYFLLGKISDAESWYETALKTDPGYYRALAGLGQVRVAQGRRNEAVELYRAAMAVIPLPEYAATLGDVYAEMGRGDEAQKQRDLVEFVARLSSLNRILYNRSLVYFYADHDIRPDQAVRLATEELKVRQDIYGHDALAWALLKAGDARDALPHINQALSLSTKDPRLYYHAGRILLALKRKDEARVDLAKALELNPHFQPLQDGICARDYAALALGGDPRAYAAAGLKSR